MRRSIATRLGLVVLRGRQFRHYQDTWDQLQPAESGSLEAALFGLPHGQIAQIALRSRLIFLVIPKNANTAVRSWLNSLELGSSGLSSPRPTSGSVKSQADTAYADSRRATHTLAQVPSGLRASMKNSNMTVATVLRDPASRLLSCFLAHRADKRSPVYRSLPSSAWDSPETFLRKLSKGENLYRDGHWAPQHWQIASAVDHVSVWLRFENLRADLRDHFQAECEIAPFPRLEAHTGRTTQASSRLDELSEFARHAVEEIYSDDYALLRKLRPR